MFYSDKFIYDNIESESVGIVLVSETIDILNKYGVSTLDEEITLIFSYVDYNDKPKVWDEEVLEFVHKWFISNDYKRFVSCDNVNISYLMRGTNIEKRFTSDMKGLIDVGFKLLTSYGYKEDITTVESSNLIPGDTNVYIASNLSDNYKPTITLSNINSSSVSIKNVTTGKSEFVINELLNTQTVTIDNEIGTIYDENDNNLIMNSNRKWIELQNGSNKIIISGECNVEIKSFYPVMV